MHQIYKVVKIKDKLDDFQLRVILMALAGERIMFECIPFEDFQSLRFNYYYDRKRTKNMDDEYLKRIQRIADKYHFKIEIEDSFDGPYKIEELDKLSEIKP